MFSNNAGHYAGKKWHRVWLHSEETDENGTSRKPRNLDELFPFPTSDICAISLSFYRNRNVMITNLQTLSKRLRRISLPKSISGQFDIASIGLFTQSISSRIVNIFTQQIEFSVVLFKDTDKYGHQGRFHILMLNQVIQVGCLASLLLWDFVFALE